MNDEEDAALQALMPYNKRVILTGAGFSKNWGGYDSGEMWDALLRHVEGDRLRRVVLSLQRLNFEEAIAEVELNPSKYDAADRIEMRKAVRQAYREHDANIRGSAAQLTGWLNKVIVELARPGDNQPLTSCFFTLNQDLVLERFCTTPEVVIPGVSRNPAWFGGELASPQVGDVQGVGSDVAQVEVQFLREARCRVSYMKLHGSIDWRDSQRGDVLIIGGSKEEDIARLPALRAAHRVFRHALMSQEVELLVVGYGFGDDHINRVIADGVRDARLRLHIVDVMPRERLRERLNERVPGCLGCAREPRY